MLLFQHFVCRVFAIMRSPYSLARDWIPDPRLRHHRPGTGNPSPREDAMKRYIITAESGISGTCNLGDGETPAAAWADAFGPKPWGDYQKRAAKKAWVHEVELEPGEPVDYSGH